MLEKSIEHAVVVWASKRGFLCPKVTFVEAGWPDRLFISPYGHTIFIEFKRPGYKPSELQYYRLNELCRRGVPAFWADSKERAIGILQAALDSQAVPEASDKAAPVPSVGGSVSGPRLGQDVDGPRYDKDFDAEEAREAHTNSGAPTMRVQSLAGRDRKMGGVSPPTVDGTPWDPEGG